jgi:hypothetical protein
LEIGADDYICKPFSPREVVARVKAVLRRTRPVAESQKIESGALTLDPDTRQVSVYGEPLHLTPNEFDLLKVLMSHPERVFERGDLIALVQGYDFEGYDRTIDSYSTIYENDRTTPTGLAGYLRERGLTHIFLAGLAFDFCVFYSAEDAHREGFAVTVVEDACRGIDVNDSAAAARAALARYDIPCVTAASIG